MSRPKCDFMTCDNKVEVILYYGGYPPQPHEPEYKQYCDSCEKYLGGITPCSKQGKAMNMFKWRAK